jgi:hypothetical protein
MQNPPKIDCYDSTSIIEGLRKSPHTYNTLIGDCGSNNTTMHTILRRRLNLLCKEGLVFKMSIPGTRSGQMLFYTMPKSYYILVEDIHIGSRTFYFEKFKRIKQEEHFEVKKIHVDKCWALKRDKWEEQPGREFSEFSILLFI